MRSALHENPQRVPPPPRRLPREPVLREGETIWRREHADRVAFLVDGEAYYGAVARALATARHSIFLLGWDVHSGVRLLRGEEHDALPPALGDRLTALLAKNPRLEVHVLDWDFPIFFAHDREPRMRSLTQWPESPRFHFHFDSFYPPGASHHQKIIVVDDALAFCGGMDIGVGRWDSSEHLPVDRRRNDPDFANYVPAHDVMMLADGDYARCMGELARRRWKAATGTEAVGPAPREDGPAPREDGPASWPSAVPVDLEDVDIGISRTIPAHETQQPVVEIEKLYLAAIASARRQIYIENQYLTSDVVVDALEKRLREADGPEILIVLPQNNFGWFESRTIQVLHFRRIRELRASDLHDRLRICYPLIPEIGDKQVNLHSKVLIVDDELLRIGSSNITNRSMRLDTECDVSIEARGNPRLRRGIDAFRSRLLAEHLCMDRCEVLRELEDGASLVALVDSRIRASRCLRNVEPAPEQLEGDIGDGTAIDPTTPITSEVVIETFAPPPVRRRARVQLLRFAALVLLLGLLAASWRWTPLAEWIRPETLTALGEGLRGHSAAPLLVLGIYLVAAVLVLPVTVLIIATAAIFGPLLGIAYSLAGSLASAMMVFFFGRIVGRRTVQNVAGRHYLRIANSLRHRGLLTMIAIRLLPIAPFTIVNMVLGVTGIRAVDFALGTVIGMSPGIVAISLFQTQLEEALRNPGMQSLLLLVLVSAALFGMLTWLRQRLRVARQTQELRSSESLASPRPGS